MHLHPPQQHAANPEGLVPGSACPLGAPWPLSSAWSITNVYLITCAGSRAVRRWLQTAHRTSQTLKPCEWGSRGGHQEPGEGLNPKPASGAAAAPTRSHVRIQMMTEVAPSTDSFDGRGAASVP